MKNTWRHFLRRLAVGGVVSGSMAWSSAMSYAVQVASDTPGNAAYADGWQEGDNGGFGFGPWSFDGTSVNLVYNVAASHEIDDGMMSGTQSSSIHNDIGQAWTMYNFNARAFLPSNTPEGATDITRAGRALSTPLQVGQTVTVIIDNPIQRAFWRGYNFKLNTGGANVCYDGATCTPGKTPVNVWGVGTFEYFSYGQWGGTTLYDEHTDSGVRIEFTLTGADTYSFTMTPFDTMYAPYTETGTLEVTDPIDWIEFQFYNTDSDFYPNMVANPEPTDFYIRSLEVTAPDAPGVPGDYNGNGKVDAADYVVYRKHVGTSFQLDNEVAGVTPGSVTPEDYEAWQARFGNMGSGSGASAVPEPGTFVYVVFAVAGLLLWGVRRSAMESAPRLAR